MHNRDNNHQPDANGDTPVHLACKNPTTKVFSEFIEHGDYISIVRKALTTQNNDGKTPVHLAVQGGYRVVLESLIRYLGDAVRETLTIKDKDGQTPASLAANLGYASIFLMPIMEIGLYTGDDNGDTLLHMLTKNWKQSSIINHLNITSYDIIDSFYTLKNNEGKSANDYLDYHQRSCIMYKLDEKPFNYITLRDEVRTLSHAEAQQSQYIPMASTLSLAVYKKYTTALEEMLKHSDTHHLITKCPSLVSYATTDHDNPKALALLLETKEGRESLAYHPDNGETAVETAIRLNKTTFLCEMVKYSEGREVFINLITTKRDLLNSKTVQTALNTLPLNLLQVYKHYLPQDQKLPRCAIELICEYYNKIPGNTAFLGKQ